VTPLASADDTGAQQVFPTPGAAINALVAADKADDVKALSTILGPDSDQILSSGDPVADKNARAEFVRRYDEMHRLAYDEQGRVILYIGANNWPVPIPLVKKDGGWVFDTAAGKGELLFRRIGRNELFTIKVLEDLADAQSEYASGTHDGGVEGEFAQKILSDAGKQNGLYWETAEGQPESPIGPLVAKATAAGYKKDNGDNPIPFHGYYYKILTGQGRTLRAALRIPGRWQDDEWVRVLAYPAEYRASGVMTFMINQDGVIVQRPWFRYSHVGHQNDSIRSGQDLAGSGRVIYRWRVGSISQARMALLLNCEKKSVDASFRIGIPRCSPRSSLCFWCDLLPATPGPVHR